MERARRARRHGARHPHVPAARHLLALHRHAGRRPRPASAGRLPDAARVQGRRRSRRSSPSSSTEGLRPWQAKKLYRGVGFRPDPANPPTTAGADRHLRPGARPHLRRDRRRRAQPAQVAGDGRASSRWGRRRRACSLRRERRQPAHGARAVGLRRHRRLACRPGGARRPARRRAARRARGDRRGRAAGARRLRAARAARDRPDARRRPARDARRARGARGGSTPRATREPTPTSCSRSRSATSPRRSPRGRRRRRSAGRRRDGGAGRHGRRAACGRSLADPARRQGHRHARCARPRAGRVAPAPPPAERPTRTPFARREVPTHDGALPRDGAGRRAAHAAVLPARAAAAATRISGRRARRRRCRSRRRCSPAHVSLEIGGIDRHGHAAGAVPLRRPRARRAAPRRQRRAGGGRRPRLARC